MITKTILFLTLLDFKISHIPHNQTAAGGLPIILDGTNAHPFIHSNQATTDHIIGQEAELQKTKKQ